MNRRRRRVDKFILDERDRPVPERDLFAWAKWFASAYRTVAVTEVEGIKISTIFLGLDHNYNENGPPILWETMAFNASGEALNQCRCAGNREQAEAMHAEVVASYSKRKSPK